MKPKKSLGQNWLKSASAIQAIIDTAKIEKKETILEIGPGQGVLTQALLEAGARVWAIEKDDRLLEFLNEKFAEPIKTGHLNLIHDDILNLNWTELAIENKINNYKLVANIPYYLTGQIIRKFLSQEKKQPRQLVLMIQKEVAQRIIAADKKESLLSISVKVYGQPRYIKTVPAGAFEPKPKIDSAILSIENISRAYFENLDESSFFSLLRAGFSHKRKMLAGNLQISKETLKACGLTEKVRAENLSPNDWQKLAQTILDGSTDNTD